MYNALKKKIDKLDFINVKSYWSAKDTVKKWKDKPQMGRIYLQNTLCEERLSLKILKTKNKNPVKLHSKRKIPELKQVDKYVNRHLTKAYIKCSTLGNYGK